MATDADYIFYGGEIITMDENCPTAEALAVKNDKIIGVGNLDDILKMKGEASKLVYLNKQTLMPGLIEPHQHAIQMVLCRCLYVNISGYYYETYEKVQEIIMSTIDSLESEDSWAIFFGWDPEIVPNMPILSADYIAKNYSSKNPVVIIGQSGHVGWANMKAFEAEPAIPADVENPEGGTFVRDKDGNLTGQFFEEPAIMAILGKAPEPKGEDLVQALKDQWREYAAAGITTTTDLAYMPNEDFDNLLHTASVNDECPIRLALYKMVHPEEEGVEPLAKKAKCCSNLGYHDHAKRTAPGAKKPITLPGVENPFLWEAGVKIVADGSPHAGTMAVREPYLKSNLTEILGFPQAPCYGSLNYSTEAMLGMVSTHHKAGKQISIHAHGERACDQAVTAYEQVLAANPEITDHRHRMEHLGLMTEEQIERASKMNLGLSFFVNHLYFYGKAYHNFIFGPERTKRWSPCSLGTKYGIRWTLHQDHATHPGPPLPMASIKTAITRTDRTDPNTVYGPEYCVSIHEALKAYTIDAAWQLHVEDKLGSLTVNKQADLVVYSENPYKCDPFKLEQIQVVETFVAGRMNNLADLVDENGLNLLKKK